MTTQKTVLITGCSSGIGKATALSLAKMGHNIIAVNRRGDKAINAFKELENIGDGKKYHYFADLSEKASLEEAVDDILQNHDVIDILINNAGVFKTKETLSTDGTEMTFAVNVRAAAILTKRLLPRIKKSSDPRVVFLSSELYKRAKINTENIFDAGKYNSGLIYARSKMFVNMLAQSLAEKTEKIRFYSVHPGVVATEAFRDYPKWFTALLSVFISKPEKGAAPVIRAAVENIQDKSGTYFMEKTPKPVKEIPQYENIQKELYRWYENV